MIRGASLKFFLPKTVEEAAALLAEEPEARCLAGGATLVAMMNADLLEPSALISLRDVESLGCVSRDAEGGIAFGAMANHAGIAAMSGCDGGQRVVRDAARVIGHPAIRNMGTIGGSVAHADPAADYPAALVAADASIEVTGAQGRREVDAADFFVDYLETALRPGEMVSAVRLPPAPDGAVSAYEKFARVDGDFATVSVAVVLSEEDGRCDHARISLGGCGPTPVRSAEAEAVLVEKGISKESISTACEALAAAADPMDDFRGSAEYRLLLIPVLVERAVASAREGGRT